MTQHEFNRKIVEILDSITSDYNEMSRTKAEINSLLEYMLPVDQDGDDE